MFTTFSFLTKYRKGISRFLTVLAIMYGLSVHAKDTREQIDLKKVYEQQIKTQEGSLFGLIILVAAIVVAAVVIHNTSNNNNNTGGCQCDDISFGGTNSSVVCAGTGVTHEVTNYSKWKTITWAVTGTSNPEIYQVGGVSTTELGLYITALKNAGYIPQNAKLTAFSATRDSGFSLTFNGNAALMFNYNLVTGTFTSATVSGNINSVFSIDPTKVFNALFRQDAAKNISVLHNQKGNANVVVSASQLNDPGCIAACGTKQANFNTQVVDGVNNNPRILEANTNNVLVATNTTNPTAYVVSACSATSNYGFTTDYVEQGTYLWQLRNVTNGQNTLVGSGTSQYFSISGLQAGNLYGLYMQATDKCGRSFTSALPITIAAALTASIPTYTSCNSSSTTTVNISGGVPPYQVNLSNWSGGGNFSPASFTGVTTNSVQTTFNSTAYGNKNINVVVRDKNNCYVSANSIINTFGGGGNNANISGWLSGKLKFPTVDKTQGNLVTNGFGGDRVYYVDDQTKNLFFYSFDNNSNSWTNTKVNNNPNITFNPKPDGLLQYEIANGKHFLFSIESGSNAITLMKLGVNGLITGIPLRFSSNSFTQMGAITPFSNYAYKVIPQDQNNMVVVWRNVSNKIYAARYTTTDDWATATETAYAEVVSDNGFGILRYDIENAPGRLRVFYVRSGDGIMYYKDLDNNFTSTGFGTAVNTNTSAAWNETDINFDLAGNIYFVANGVVQSAKYNNATNSYNAVYALGNTQSCNGHFTVNKSSGTIYFAGYDGNFYQMFPTNLSTNTWTQYKSTPTGWGTNGQDQAKTYMVYSSPHVFYVAPTNEIYNLYYINTIDPACIPRNIRKDNSLVSQDNPWGGEGERLSSTLIYSEEQEQGTVIPNPFNNEITVSVKGEGLGTVNIYNDMGILVTSQSYGFVPTQINTSHLTSGLYICQVKMPNGSVKNFKIVK